MIRPHRLAQSSTLNDALLDELGAGLELFELADTIGCIVLSGSERTLSAAADVEATVHLDDMWAFRAGLIMRN